jgi:hypothetical protein
MSGGGIGPGIAQRSETSLFSGDRGEGIEQVSGRPRQPLQPDDSSTNLAINLVSFYKT